MKTCFKCGLTKPLDEFYKHSRMADGHLNKCKECCKKDGSENYYKNRIRYAMYDRVRNNTLERREARKRRREKYNTTIQRKAHQAISNALQYGKIERQPCEVCGSIDKVEAHHYDYTKPLEVIWLCRKHHCETHGKSIIELDSEAF